MTSPLGSDACSVCGFPRIPGITTCVNCGQPSEVPSVTIDIIGRTGRQPPSADDIERYKRENAAARDFVRRFTEARALEYAGDVAGATAIYEQFLEERLAFTEPYKRLAIIYRKAKQPAKEERAVRAALAVIQAGPNSWFVLRLAKILGEKKGR